MASFRKLKKFSAATFSAFSKPLSLYLLAALAAGGAWAESGVVSAVGYGRESPDAIQSLLRSVVDKYFKDEPAALTKSVLQNEILPNASSFVQSYKILEGGRGTPVSLSASVDLDIIRALFSLTPAELGEAGGAKALVVVKGARLPENVKSAKSGSPAPDPYEVLEAGARERFARRKFEVSVLGGEELAALGAGEEVSSAELLRGLGARAGARVALGISSRYEAFENENAHSKDQRIVVYATLVDVKTGAVLGRSSANVSEPKGRRDQYAADLQRSLVEEGKDLFHDTFVSAGKRLAKASGHEDFSLVRVEKPGNAALVGKFRLLLETIKGVKSVVEYSATRGAFDFAVSPAQKDAALAKAIKGLSPEDLSVTVLEPAVVDAGVKVPAITVTLAAKEAPVPPTTEEVHSGNP